MNHLQKRGKKRGTNVKSTSSFSRRDKLKLWGWIAGFILIIFGRSHFLGTHNHRVEIDQLIERWRHDYHLSDEQASRVHAMEEIYHGSGDHFTRPSHTLLEKREHHREIAAVMNPEDGSNFFRTEEGIDLPHTPK